MKRLPLATLYALGYVDGLYARSNLHLMMTSELYALGYEAGKGESKRRHAAARMLLWEPV